MNSNQTQPSVKPTPKTDKVTISNSVYPESRFVSVMWAGIPVLMAILLAAMAWPG